MSFINAFVPMVQMLTPLRKMENPPCFFKIIFLGVRVPGYPMDFPHPRCSSRLTKTRKGLFLGADGLSHFNAMDAGSEGGEINVHADSCPSNFDCRPTAIHSSTGMLPQCSWLVGGFTGHLGWNHRESRWKANGPRNPTKSYQVRINSADFSLAPFWPVVSHAKHCHTMVPYLNFCGTPMDCQGWDPGINLCVISSTSCLAEPLQEAPRNGL